MPNVTAYVGEICTSSLDTAYSLFYLARETTLWYEGSRRRSLRVLELYISETLRRSNGSFGLSSQQ